MERRRFRRTKKRLACELHQGDRRFLGIVLDVSPQGLFVQTSAKLTPGEEVEVELTLPTTNETLHLPAKVARMKIVPQELLSVAQGGIGLRIKKPPPAFRAFVRTVEMLEDATVDGEPEQAEADSAKAAKAAAQDAKSAQKKRPRRFRVKVRQGDGLPLKTFLVDAASMEKARQRVVSKVGDSSKIAEIEPA